MVKPTGMRMFEMLKDGIMTDVTFVVQGTEIQAHRTVVSSHGGPLRELLENKTEKVEIDAITPQTFNTVLEYLYTDDCVVSTMNVFGLLHAAHKFSIVDLEFLCTKSGVLQLSETNLGEVTQQALNFDAKEYLSLCKEYFRKNAMDVLNKNEFLEISNEVLDELYITEDKDCSEIDIFAACMRWAESECKRRNLQGTPEELRKVLGKVFTRIDFSKISTNDFLEFVTPLGILTHEEIGRLIFNRQKDTKYVDWNKRVKVNVEFYFELFSFTSLFVPQYTRISELKKMKIFQEGQLSCPPDKFTLKHNGIILSDETTLASLYTGNVLRFFIHSLTCTVKESEGRWEFPVTFTRDDLWRDKQNKIINCHLPLHEDMHNKVAEIVPPSDKPIPDSTYIVTIKAA